jgi:hypothetical protein
MGAQAEVGCLEAGERSGAELHAAGGGFVKSKLRSGFVNEVAVQRGLARACALELAAKGLLSAVARGVTWADVASRWSRSRNGAAPALRQQQSA